MDHHLSRILARDSHPKDGYILVGNKYYPFIKRRKSDVVYWADLYDYERISEQEIREHLLPQYMELSLRWYGCGRAQVRGFPRGLPYLKYIPCDKKPVRKFISEDKSMYRDEKFCKAHMKTAIKNGRIPGYIPPHT
tara:strand:+ start:1194 stop:1601 length:408 start_codon:yes stop_codon:yes gene_type:complete